MMRTAGTALLMLLFAAVGLLSWSLQLRGPLRVDAGPLLALPHAVDAWSAVDVPLDGSVESILRADANVQRLYAHPSGERVSLYVGYYGTDRGGRPEHTPEVCYRSQGWDVLERRVLDVPGAPGLRANEYLVDNQGRRDLVLFWFRSHRRTGLVGGLDQTVDRLLGRLLDGRADGSLVRVSTPIRPGDEGEARTALLGFARAIDAQLGSYWPAEAAIAAANR
jgi:EpsI family protein